MKSNDVLVNSFDLRIEFRKSLIKTIIDLMLEAYNLIKYEDIGTLPIENRRRYHLTNAMTKLKIEKGLSMRLSTESDQVDYDELVSTGRVDIEVYTDLTSAYGYRFECKRFVNYNTQYKSTIKDCYIKDGLDCFTSKHYDISFFDIGMIAFLEEEPIINDFNNALIKVINEHKCLLDVADISTEFNHNYVFYSEHARCDGKRLNTYHLLLDFT